MQISKKELPLVVILFLYTLYVWTLPIQSNTLPFGENDAAHQYTLGDYVVTNDRGITQMPRYLFLWYDNYVEQGITTLQYPPPTHLNYAISNVISGDRFVPVHIYIALSTSLFVFSVFFLIRKLYGAIPGYVTLFTLIFALRSIMSYLWGQRGTVLSLSFVPLIIYTYYQYVQKKKPVYIYIIVLLIYCQYVFHLMGLLMSLIIIAVYSIITLIRKKKLTLHYKHIGIAAVLFIFLSLTFLPIYLNRPEELSTNRGDISTLFEWYKVEGRRTGYPEFYYHFDQVYKGNWSLIFLYAGIIMLILRRKEQDWFMLSWLISLYLIIHLDFFGVWEAARSARALILEEYLFFPLMVLGAFLLPSVIPLKKHIKNYLRIGFVILFLVFFIPNIALPNYGQLSAAYQGISRINPEQYEFAQWADATLEEDAIFQNIGILTYAKARFILALSHRYTNWQDIRQWQAWTPDQYNTFINESTYRPYKFPDYFIVDYSDLARLGNQGVVNKLLDIEQSLFEGQTPVYNTQLIRVYKNENKNQ